MSRPPHPAAPGVAAGISEELIHGLVREFYGRVRLDPLLGPIFEAAVEDWDAHLTLIAKFWSSVTLMTGRYKGTPMQAHVALPGIANAHFERWLALFEATAHETCPPEAAALLVGRAQLIASSLKRAISVSRGDLSGDLSSVASTTLARAG